MTARLLRRLRDESGLTLVEMSVVLILLGVVMAFTLNSVASFQRSASGGIRRIENLNEARILMQVITKDIRTAAKLDAASSPFFVDPANPTTLVLADDNDLTFYANLNQSTQCPKKVRLYVDGNDKLIESVTEPDAGDVPPTCTYDEGTPRNRLVGRYIANDPTEPIFTYYYADPDTGELVAFDPETQTPLSIGDSLLVKAVGIELAIRKDTSLSVAHTTVLNKVRLPNVYYNPPPTTSPSP